MRRFLQPEQDAPKPRHQIRREPSPIIPLMERPESLVSDLHGLTVARSVTRRQRPPTSGSARWLWSWLPMPCSPGGPESPQIGSCRLSRGVSQLRSPSQLITGVLMRVERIVGSPHLPRAGMLKAPHSPISAPILHRPAAVPRKRSERREAALTSCGLCGFSAASTSLGPSTYTGRARTAILMCWRNSTRTFTVLLRLATSFHFIA